MVATHAIDRGLTVDGHVAALVHLPQRRRDDPRLRLQLDLAPGQLWDVPRDILLENRSHLRLALRRVPPHGLPIQLAQGVVEVVLVAELSKRRRASIAPPSVRELVPLVCPRQVALRAVGPVNGPHVLLLAIGKRARAPRELPPRGNSREARQGSDDLTHAALQVEGVEMKSRHELRVQELARHLDRVVDAEALHGLVIAADRLQRLGNLRRHLGLAHRRHPLEGIEVLDRHDARDDRARDAGLAAVLDVLQKDVDVIEELGEDEVCAGVHLLLEVLQLFRPACALRVPLWVPGHADAKVVAVLLPNEPHEVHGPVQAPLHGDPGRHSLGRVSSQGQHILQPLVLGFLQDGLELLPREAGAREVHEHVHAVVLLQRFADLQAQLAGRAPGAPRDVHKQGLQGCQAVDAPVEVLHAGFARQNNS
eukprot:scaffold1857_cov247-Pinguiococcus_pyrenoidosus.AAC.5